MIGLRSFDTADLSVLREHVLKKYSDSDIIKTIYEWNTQQYSGKYFEMLAICLDNTVIGAISIYQKDHNTISIGPEIFPTFQRNGYANIAMRQALSYAKFRGFKVATAQIRKNNIASISLHEKLGFKLDSETLNRHGNEVFNYSKII